MKVPAAVSVLWSSSAPDHSIEGIGNRHQQRRNADTQDENRQRRLAARQNRATIAGRKLRMLRIGHINGLSRVDFLADSVDWTC